MAKSKNRSSTAAGSGAKSADAGAKPFPTKEEILAFIEDSPGPVGKREIARAFRIEGGDRIQLKAVMRELRREGALERRPKRPKRKVARRGHLPPVTVLEVSGIDADGELLARWGNLVHRVLTITGRNFDGRVPDAPEQLAPESVAILERVDGAFDTVGAEIEAVHLRAALGEAMSVAQDANRYLD